MSILEEAAQQTRVAAPSPAMSSYELAWLLFSKIVAAERGETQVPQQSRDYYLELMKQCVDVVRG